MAYLNRSAKHALHCNGLLCALPPPPFAFPFLHTQWNAFLTSAGKLHLLLRGSNKKPFTPEQMAPMRLFSATQVQRGWAVG